jgi:hypothetical protein
MAKKSVKLGFLDIVMGADAQTIKEAYEARVKVDEQLTLREEAYQQIAKIEEDIEEIIGKEGQFVFPAPPLPVAGYSRLIPASRPAPKPIAKPTAAVKPEVTEADETLDKKPVEPQKSQNGGIKSSASK